MNLAFCLFNYFPFGGLERDFLSVAIECRRRGHRVTVFSMKWEGSVPENITVILVPAQGISNHTRVASFVKNLPKKLHRLDYDLVMGMNRIPGLDLYFAADSCYLDRVHKHRSFFSRVTPRYRLFSAFEKAVFGHESSTEVIYLSDQEKMKYQRIYGTPDDKFHYAPPGVDKKKIQALLNEHDRLTIRRELNLDENDTLLLMVGSHFKTKGVDRSLRAVASLAQESKKSTFLFIIGRGNTTKYSDMAQKLGIGKKVTFLGERDDVPRFLMGADMLLQPSVMESAGNTIVEALVAGTPVLATGTCGYAEHVSKAQAGIVIPGDPFRQEHMNSAFKEMISALHYGHWRSNALAYADTADLYNRTQVVVDLIETMIQSKRQ